MKTLGKLIAIALLGTLALVVPATTPAQAADPLPANNDFILRAPAAEIAGIASRNNLTVVSQVATAVDEDGHSIYLMRAAAGATAASVISDIEAFEPTAAGVEQVVLASLPKLNQSTATILDTSTVDNALGLVYGFSSPSAVLDATWNGHTHERQIKKNKDETLEFQFEATADTDPANYTVQATFSGGETTFSVGSFSFSAETVTFDVTNTGNQDLYLDSVSINWPAANGKLLIAKLGGDSILDAPYQEFGENPDGSDRILWTGYLNQPAVTALEVNAAQSIFGGEATVAIIDTGIDETHEVLANNIVPGHDFVNDIAGSASEWADVDQSTATILDQSTATILDQSTATILDQSTATILDQSTATILDTSSLPVAFGHGTMVAGVIHRAAPKASLMPLKAFNANGHAHLYDIVDAIYFAVDNGANVINMSFSLETFSPALMRAVNYAARNGVACVGSAGNNGEEVLVYPASFGNTIGVASVDDSDALSAFSNWGSDLVTVSAPGENIVTTYPGSRFAVTSGTSFAAPWIAGGAALFADKLGTKHAPGLADYYLSSNALTNADPVSGGGADRSGYGRANLRLALDSVKSGRYANDRPLGAYTLTATFAEGCTASYPPPSTGGGCTVEGAGQLRFHNKKLMWDLTNEGESDVTLDSLTIAWETDNGDLEKIRLDGTIIESTITAPSTTTVSSGWLGTAGDRVITPHETLELELEFANDVIWTY